MSKATGYAETEESTQVVNEVVVFIRFADEPESIYDERGGYEYIMGMYNGAANSLKAKQVKIIFINLLWKKMV